MKKLLAVITTIIFIINTLVPPSVFAQTLSGAVAMPQPGTMTGLSQAFIPAHLVGMTLDPTNALNFDFVIHKGDRSLTADQKREEYQTLVKYFLAALAVPDEAQWVNLSPYEGSRIIDDNFGLTEMGRDLLGQDYLLKQLTASMMYPDSELGKKFWARVYELAWQKYGTTDVPVDTFNKIWIVPDKAVVYEKGQSAFIVESHLKVMTERDYLSIENNAVVRERGASAKTEETTQLSSQVVKEVILPEIEREVNEGRNFANLRQIVSAMILATWYKKALKESLLGKIYADKGKVKGIDQDPKNNQAIYEQYLEAFKKGAFNLIREDIDRYSQELIPRKYFSGGFKHGDIQLTHDLAQATAIQAGAAKGEFDAASVTVDPAHMTRRAFGAIVMAPTLAAAMPAVHGTGNIFAQQGGVQPGVMRGTPLVRSRPVRPTSDAYLAGTVNVRDVRKQDKFPATGIYRIGPAVEGAPAVLFGHGAWGAPANFMEQLTKYEGKANLFVYEYDFKKGPEENAKELRPWLEGWLKNSAVNGGVLFPHSYLCNVVAKAAAGMTGEGRKALKHVGRIQNAPTFMGSYFVEKLDRWLGRIPFGRSMAKRFGLEKISAGQKRGDEVILGIQADYRASHDLFAWTVTFFAEEDNHNGDGDTAKDQYFKLILNSQPDKDKDIYVIKGKGNGHTRILSSRQVNDVLANGLKVVDRAMQTNRRDFLTGGMVVIATKFLKGGMLQAAVDLVDPFPAALKVALHNMPDIDKRDQYIKEVKTILNNVSNPESVYETLIKTASSQDGEDAVAKNVVFTVLDDKENTLSPVLKDGLENTLRQKVSRNPADLNMALPIVRTLRAREPRRLVGWFGLVFNGDARASAFFKDFVDGRPGLGAVATEFVKDLYAHNMKASEKKQQAWYQQLTRRGGAQADVYWAIHNLAALSVLQETMGLFTAGQMDELAVDILSNAHIGDGGEMDSSFMVGRKQLTKSWFGVREMYFSCFHELAHRYQEYLGIVEDMSLFSDESLRIRRNKDEDGFLELMTFLEGMSELVALITSNRLQFPEGAIVTNEVRRDDLRHVRISALGLFLEDFEGWKGFFVGMPARAIKWLPKTILPSTLQEQHMRMRQYVMRNYLAGRSKWDIHLNLLVEKWLPAVEKLKAETLRLKAKSKRNVVAPWTLSWQKTAQEVERDYDNRAVDRAMQAGGKTVADLIAYLTGFLRRNPDKDVQKAVDFVSASLNNDGKVLVELGGGNGNVALELAQRNPGLNIISTDVYDSDFKPEPDGIDYGEYARSWEQGTLPAQEAKKENLALLRADASLLLSLPDYSVDYILLVNPVKQVLSSIFGPDHNEIMRKLKPGGQIVVKTLTSFNAHIGFYVPEGLRNVGEEFLGVNLNTAAHFEGESTEKDIYVLDADRAMQVKVANAATEAMLQSPPESFRELVTFHTGFTSSVETVWNDLMAPLPVSANEVLRSRVEKMIAVQSGNDFDSGHFYREEMSSAVSAAAVALRQQRQIPVPAWIEERFDPDKVREAWKLFHSSRPPENPAYDYLTTEHFQVLKYLLWARLRAACQAWQKATSDREREVFIRLMNDSSRRILGYSQTATVSFAGKEGEYSELFRKIDAEAPAQEFFRKENRFQVDGKEYVFYQSFGKNKDKNGEPYFDIYHPAVDDWMPVLDRLWEDVGMAKTAEERFRWLATYEWLFYNVNPFGRSGAALGDAMSSILQLLNGMPLRDGFEHVDWEAIASPLESYVAKRTEQFRVLAASGNPSEVTQNRAVQLGDNHIGIDRAMQENNQEKETGGTGTRMLKSNPAIRWLIAEVAGSTEAAVIRDFMDRNRDSINDAEKRYLEQSLRGAEELERIEIVIREIGIKAEKIGVYVNDEEHKHVLRVIPDAGPGAKPLNALAEKYRQIGLLLVYSPEELESTMAGFVEEHGVVLISKKALETGMIQFADLHETDHVTLALSLDSIFRGEAESINGIDISFKDADKFGRHFARAYRRYFSFEELYVLARDLLRRNSSEGSGLSVMPSALRDIATAGEGVSFMTVHVLEKAIESLMSMRRRGEAVAVEAGFDAVVLNAQGLKLTFPMAAIKKKAGEELGEALLRHVKELQQVAISMAVTISNISQSGERGSGRWLNVLAQTVRKHDPQAAGFFKEFETSALLKGISSDLAQKSPPPIRNGFKSVLWNAGQANNNGGIDLNQANLGLEIRRDGNGVPLPVSQQNLENIHIDGLVPTILEIRPLTNLPVLSEAPADLVAAGSSG